MASLVLWLAWGCSGGGKDAPPPPCADKIVTYRDADGDGWGDLAASQNDCGTVPEGRVTQAGDCDDADPDVNPGIAEVCDGFDNDCSGEADDGLSVEIWYPDGDGDGIGVEPGVEGCAQPAGHVAISGDCDDADPANFPDNPEVCDGGDNDCDELVDDDDNTTQLSSMTEAFPDADEDGFGDEGGRISRCEVPPGFVTETGDCDDGDAAINPDAQEVCGGADDDCDTLVDLDDPSLDATPISLYPDLDGDGLGDPAGEVQGCSPGPSQVANDQDCDDGNASVGAAGDWVTDDDRDGYGTGPVVLTSCDAGPGFVLEGGPQDCDDTAAGVNPGETEICDDGIDQDCDTVDPPCIVEVTYPVGDTYSAFLGADRFRGNLFMATEDGLLSHFSMYLDLMTVCTLDWYVHSAPSLAGPLTTEWAGQTVAAGPGLAMYDSPAIDLPTTAGTLYGLGVGFNCDVGYFRAGDFSWVGVDAGIGAFETWYADDAYPGYSSTYVPPLIQIGIEYAYCGEVVMWE